MRRSIELDLSLIAHYDGLLRTLESELIQMAKAHDGFSVQLLRSIPGVGRILSLVLLYEIDSIDRFPRVNEFLSYARLVKPKKESNGKVYGHSGKKIGKALSILAARLGRAVYVMLKRRQPFDPVKFMTPS